MLDKLVITEKKLTKLTNDYHIIARYNDEKVCTAVIVVKPRQLLLQWIETTEDYQHRGIASCILNYLSDKCIEEKRDMEIKVVDEELLNNFYLRWFTKKTDPQNSNPDKVKEKFESFLNEGYNIKMTCHDLEWDVNSGRSLRMR